MAQKVVLDVVTMTDAKTRQKVMALVAEINGVDSIAADLKNHSVTVVGEMDSVKVAKKLKKMGTVNIVSVAASK